MTIGPSWSQTALTLEPSGVYAVDPGVPMTGWRSYFVELVFDHPGASTGLEDFDYHFTTEMRVLPEVRPFEADFTRDRLTNLDDLAVLVDHWLVDTPYYDIIPRRNGDGIINLADMTTLSLHWLAD